MVMLLPGPPHELKAMFERQCLPRLARIVPKQVIRTLFLRVTGMSESDLDRLIAPVYKKYENPVTTILAANGDIQIHLRARCSTVAEAEALLAEVGGPIELLLGDRIYSRNGDPLEVVVGELLRKKPRDGLRWRKAPRGGMLGERIHVGAGQLRVLRRRLHHVHQPDENRVAGRAGRDPGGVRRGQQGDRGSDGAGRAAAHRRHLCAFDHRRGRTGCGRREVRWVRCISVWRKPTGATGESSPVSGGPYSHSVVRTQMALDMLRRKLTLL